VSAAQELLEIRSLARDFAAAELRPRVEHWDAARALDEGVVAKIAELGFFGMLVPESDGGMDFDLPTYLAALEEIAWGEPAVALLLAHSVIAADLLSRFGGPAHAGLLAELAAGTKIGCIAFAGDHTAARAVRSDSGWTLSGTRHWVTNGDAADVALVMVHDDAGPALFVVPRSGGYRVGRVADTMGLRTVPVVSIELDGVSVPDDARLGWRGAEPHAELHPIGTLSAAAIATAIAQAALEHAIRYAGEREQFGRPLRAFEGIQAKLAEMATRTAGARALVERAAANAEDRAAAAMAKLAAATCAMFVTTEAVQIFGGYGYMRDYPVEKLMRDAKAMEILHGTSEMQRLRIAASLYAE
jgi:alkylation response protein AidB-like acyl-CoA dehydrogenase